MEMSPRNLGLGGGGSRGQPLRGTVHIYGNSGSLIVMLESFAACLEPGRWA